MPDEIEDISTETVPPVPYVETPIAPPAGPTVAQHEWMAKHPRHIRHTGHRGRFIERGTLHADGSFIPESQHPVMDGPSCFGVGIPV